jgi:hypothetical protein
MTDDDPYAGLRVDVATYAHADPVATLRSLSDASGIPTEDLVHYVLARWASGGTEAILELGVSGVDHLARLVRDAEAAGTDADRLAAYAAIRDVVSWLRAGIGPSAGVGDDLTEPTGDVADHGTSVGEGERPR